MTPTAIHNDHGEIYLYHLVSQPVAGVPLTEDGGFSNFKKIITPLQGHRRGGLIILLASMMQVFVWLMW